MSPKQLCLFLALLLGTLTAFAQKNRISLGYHSAYIIERGTFSKLGLQLSLERQLSPRWSILGEYALDDYCRCDVGSYGFRIRKRNAALFNRPQSSPNLDVPGLSRFSNWTIIGQYLFPIGPQSNQHIGLGTGLAWRSGFEYFLQAITWELVLDVRFSSDWAIPIRLSYRYDPPHRWWGLTAFVLYQGYFHYETDYLGNNPMNVLHTGINFDVRWGKREQLKREK
jgi:hypothetical protein